MLNKLTENAKELINNNKLQEAENLLLGLEDKYSIFELARIRKIQGRSREAEQLYLKSLSMSSEIKSHIDSDINIELGRIYASFGKVEEATARYERGIDRISLEKNIYREIGELYFSIANNTKDFVKEYANLNEAKNNLEKAIALFPNDIQTNLSLGIVYRRLGMDSFAETVFNKILSDKKLRTNKFLYNKVLNEYEILMKKKYLESNPREMRVTLTNKCNVGCRYCSVWKDSDWQISTERMAEVMSLFPYLENMYWLGGEVFLYKGFEEIMEEGSKYDALSQTILTNGLLLNERILDKIAKAKVSLLIAIDAGKKETYEYLRRGSSWEKLCSNLELIKEVNHKSDRRINTTFNAVISKSNYKEMLDMVEMAHKYDFNKIRFMPILGDSDENIFLRKDIQATTYIQDILPLLKQKADNYRLQFENTLPTKEVPYYKDINLNFVRNNNRDLINTDRKSIKCIAPWRTVVLDSKGPMRTCASCNDWIGDSTKQTIKEFWNGDNMQFIRKRFGEMYSCSGGFDVNAGPNDISKKEMHC